MRKKRKELDRDINLGANNQFKSRKGFQSKRPLVGSGHIQNIYWEVRKTKPGDRQVWQGSIRFFRGDKMITSGTVPTKALKNLEAFAKQEMLLRGLIQPEGI